MILTAVNILGSLLFLGAGAVLVGGLGVDAGGSAVGVESARADVVHGLLEGVAFPAEEVVTVGSRATNIHMLVCMLTSLHWLVKRTRGSWSRRMGWSRQWGSRCCWRTRSRSTSTRT